MPKTVETLIKNWVCPILEKIRFSCGNAPMTINSGYRSKAHNEAVGGKPKSKHLTGLATDLEVKGKTPREVETIIQGLIDTKEIPEGGLHAYSTFVHYDSRGTRKRW